ncbi:hypothetical protein DLJ53_31015 [Acuticoccus sediminis]|uniref:Uncharacterized protein n=1 Tax=Acuticoccus sediminis TaxID=2184697 RepID=A0A8B2NDD8_9HYPH|nr:hypothetical protein [Acuticoccus sediminis]RAH96698.1 hypothetical protein DLJ53_31015 [Acuticoccus sediminis]
MSTTSVSVEATRFSVYLSIFRIGESNRTFTPVLNGLRTLDEALEDAIRFQAPRRFTKTLKQLYEAEGGMVVLTNKHNLLFCAQLDDPGHLGDKFQQEKVNILEPGELLSWHRKEVRKPFSPGRIIITTLRDIAQSFRTKAGDATIMPPEAWEMLEYLIEFKPVDEPAVLVVGDTLHVIGRVRIKGEPVFDRAEVLAAAEADRDEDTNEPA